MYPVGVWFLAGIFTQRFRYSTTCDVFHFLTDKQVCISFFLNVIWWPDRVECVLPRAPGLLSLPFLFLTCDICAHIKGPGTIQGNKDPGKMLSQRKKSFTKISHAAGKKKKESNVFFFFFPSLSFYFCHSCWQSLIGSDKLMKSNTEKTTGSPRRSLHLPESAPVCALIPAHWLRLDVSCPQASQPVNTVMRQ